MRQWKPLADALADLIIKDTHVALQEALDKVEATLLEQNSMGGPQASVRMDSMLCLRMEKKQLLEDWPEQVRKYSQNFGSAPVTLGELTLVTDAEMEANLAAGAMGENLLKSQRPLFKALEVQFEKILGMAEAGLIEGVRPKASSSEAPIHPVGLAQLACTWLAAWQCPDEDRITAIHHIEKCLIDVLPKLLPAGLAIVENHLNGEKQDKHSGGGNDKTGGGNTTNSSETSSGGGTGGLNEGVEVNNTLPDDVLPLVGTKATDGNWLDTLSEAQEGLYDGGSDVLESTGRGFGANQLTPEYRSMMDDGSNDAIGHGAVNTPLYLDDLIRNSQAKRRYGGSPWPGQSPDFEMNADQDVEGGILANEIGVDDFLEGASMNFHGSSGRGHTHFGENQGAGPKDTHGLASALMGLMSRFGSWRGGGADHLAPTLDDDEAALGGLGDSSRSGPRFGQTGSDILDQARRENYRALREADLAAERSQSLTYTGKSDYDPTLDLAQIDERDFDPSMMELFSLIQARRTASERIRGSMEGEEVLRPRISPRDLGHALRVLQRTPDDTIIEAARTAGRADAISLAQVLKDSLTHHSREAGAPQDGELEDADSDAADIVGMLFEIFLTERQIDDQMRARIAKLVAPYVRVAVNDRKMFMQKTHPARRYLDTLAAAVDGNQGANFQERQMLDKAGSSIDHLTESFNEDLAIFDLAEDEMRQYIEQRKAAMALAEKRAADAQRGKERLDQAKLLADSAFERAIEECNWPVKTLEMLRGWWCQHHRMALLQDNPQSAVAESEKLLQLLVRVGNQGVVSIGTEALKAHNDIINMLSSSGLTGQNAQNATSELWAALEQASIWTRLAAQGQLSSDDMAKTSTKASREAGRAALAAQAAPEFQDLSPDVSDDGLSPFMRGGGGIDLGKTEQEGEIHDDLPVPDYFSSNQDVVDYFKNMSMGTWVDFVTADRKLVAAKLSWVSPISNRLLFVTARGTKHSVEPPENLAMMVKLDRVRLRRSGLGENGFDSSYRKALDVLASQVKADDTEI